MTVRDIAELVKSDGGLDYDAIIEAAKRVRRTMRHKNHFSRQERPLKRGQTQARACLDDLQTLASFQSGLSDDDWSRLPAADQAVLKALGPFLGFYRSHGKLPDISDGQALAYVLYRGVVEGVFDLGDPLEFSSDTPRGYYP